MKNQDTKMRKKGILSSRITNNFFISILCIEFVILGNNSEIMNTLEAILCCNSWSITTKKIVGILCDETPIEIEFEVNFSLHLHKSSFFISESNIYFMNTRICVDKVSVTSLNQDLSTQICFQSLLVNENDLMSIRRVNSSDLSVFHRVKIDYRGYEELCVKIPFELCLDEIYFEAYQEQKKLLSVKFPLVVILTYLYKRSLIGINEYNQLREITRLETFPTLHLLFLSTTDQIKISSKDQEPYETNKMFLKIDPIPGFDPFQGNQDIDIE